MWSGTDPSGDLALVQIDHASNLPTVTFGDSSQTRVGDSVLAIGNALALAGGPSVTEGIVSAENRSLTAQNDNGQTENLTGLIQTDAAINPGNSGGPLVNSEGQVVGMNTAVASDTSGNAPTQNIGFAITVDSVKPLLAKLRSGGTGGAGAALPQLNPAANSAYIGVTVGPVTPALQQADHLTPSSGALIISVEPGSPAQRSGLQVDDVIVSFNGTAIQSPDDLTAAIHPLKPGDPCHHRRLPGQHADRRGRDARSPPGRRVGCRGAAIPGGTTAMTPVTDEQMLPEEGEEPLPPVGHVRVVYLGPVAPHWEVRSDFGDPALIEEFRRRTMARLVLLPPHDPQYRRNRERVIRDAERENILLEWDLGVPEEEVAVAEPPEPGAPTSRQPTPAADELSRPPGSAAGRGASVLGGVVELGEADPLQPQPGSVHLGRRREIAGRGPQLGQAVFAGPLHDAG